MYKATVLSALALAAISGAAMGQTIDGKLDASFYGPILFVQNQPTGFADNKPVGKGDPEKVTTGVELAIPLSTIGNPSGSFRLTGWVTSPDHGFMSNQIAGGVPTDTGNLGEPRNVNFETMAGPSGPKNYVTLSPTVASTPPVIDGVVDSAYGAIQWVQSNFTGFGDSAVGAIDEANGSEIDGVFACVNGGTLYLVITGNLETNFNKLDLFFDSQAGGDNKLTGGGYPPVDFDALGRMSDDGSGNGLTFDADFTADYYITCGGGSDGAGGWDLFANYAEVKVLGAGYYLGQGEYGSDGTLTGGDEFAPAIRVTINNSNVKGVLGTPSDIPSPDLSVGSEIDGIYGKISGGKLYLLITGNVTSDFGNKLDLFFDVQPGGQQTLRGDQVDIDFGGLGRMGEGSVGGELAPGLTFDTGFAADYWLTYVTGGSPVQQYGNAAVLRTSGPLKDGSGIYPLDYGAYDGGTKSTNNPIPWDGPLADIQDGFTPSIYCNYGPRTTQKDPTHPVPNLIAQTIDNSNIKGVTGIAADGTFDVADAKNVTTGVEISIVLSEVGWDGTSPIRVCGFINSGGHDFLSNQVLGGLPDSPGKDYADNLGEVRYVDFSLIAGNQYVVIPTTTGCYADCNQDTRATVNDFICFQAKWRSRDPYGDYDGSGTYTVNDFIRFQSEWKQFQLGNCVR